MCVWPTVGGPLCMPMTPDKARKEKNVNVSGRLPQIQKKTVEVLLL